jgi:hypothetical protein
MDQLHHEEIRHLYGDNGQFYSDVTGRHHTIEAAPLFNADPESRTIGAGVGFNLGPVGFGGSAGLGQWGTGYNAALGVGNFQPYGQYGHYSQYYYPQRPAPSPLQSRTIGSGGGFNIGPFGAGSSVGLGNWQLATSGGLGFQGNYANYGRPSHYERYWGAVPHQPVFHTSQVY